MTLYQIPYQDQTSHCSVRLGGGASRLLGRNFHVGILVQSAQDHLWERRVADDEVEPRQTRAYRGGGAENLIGDRLRGVAQRTVFVVDEELHAVAQIVVQRDLGDRDVDSDLQFGPIELIQSALDDAVVFFARVDEHRIVCYIGR